MQKNKWHEIWEKRTAKEEILVSGTPPPRNFFRTETD